MAGAGSRFSKEGYDTPKPFIQVNGKNMVNQALRCLPKTDEVVFGCLRGHKNLLPLGNILLIDDFTKVRRPLRMICSI